MTGQKSPEQKNSDGVDPKADTDPAPAPDGHFLGVTCECVDFRVHGHHPDCFRCEPPPGEKT